MNNQITTIAGQHLVQSPTTTTAHLTRSAKLDCLWMNVLLLSPQKWSCLCCWVTKCLFVTWIMSNPIVEVREGKLKGAARRTDANKTYYSFKGIPYALPPVGERRFSVSTYSMPKYLPIYIIMFVCVACCFDVNRLARIQPLANIIYLSISLPSAVCVVFVLYLWRNIPLLSVQWRPVNMESLGISLTVN